MTTGAGGAEGRSLIPNDLRAFLVQVAINELVFAIAGLVLLAWLKLRQ